MKISLLLLAASIGPRKLAEKIASYLHRKMWSDGLTAGEGIRYEIALDAVQKIIYLRWTLEEEIAAADLRAEGVSNDPA